MPSAAMDGDELESNYSFGESCDFTEISDSDSETSSIALSVDEVDDYSDGDEDEQPAVKKVRTSSSTAMVPSPTITPADIEEDDRPFSQFMEEGLVEVVRGWKKYPASSKVEIKAGGALWIDGEKTHVVISKSTQVIMKKLGLANKSLFIGEYGYYARALFVRRQKYNLHI